MYSGALSGKAASLPFRLFRVSSLPFLVANLLLALALPSGAAADECDSQNRNWAAGQDYSSGEMVFYHGQWYQAGTLNQTHKPGTDPLSWRPLAKSPDCSKANLVPKKSQEPALDTSPADRPGKRKGSKTFEGATGNPDCEKAPVWTLSQAYVIGDYATHEGKTFRAIKSSQGDLPGVTKPPQWAVVDNDCSGPSSPQ